MQDAKYVQSLLSDIKECNSRITKINQENERNRGSRETIRKQISEEAKKYYEAYGVQLVSEENNQFVVNEEVIQQEFDAVCKEAEENIAKVSKMLDLINQGRFDELNLMVGAEKVETEQKQVSGLRAHGVSTGGSIQITNNSGVQQSGGTSKTTEQTQQVTQDTTSTSTPSRYGQPATQQGRRYSSQGATPTQQTPSRKYGAPTPTPVTNSRYQPQGSRPAPSGTPSVAQTSATQSQYSSLTRGTRFQGTN